MTGFAVYSAASDPKRLCSTGNAGIIDAERTVKTLWADGQPLDLVVDLAERRIWWTFEPNSGIPSEKSGECIAAFQGGSDLFRDFASQLRDVHDGDGSQLPYTGTIESELGFALQRVSPTVAGTGPFDKLVDALATQESTDTSPIQLGMTTYRRALAVIRGIDNANIDCTVAIDTRKEIAVNENIDLLLDPTAEEDYDVQSRHAVTLESATAATTTARTIPDQESSTTNRQSELSVVSQVALLALVGLLALAVYSFFIPHPVRPISGLGTVGGLLGSTTGVALWAFMNQPGGSARQWLRAHRAWIVLAVTVGTLAGFAFPSIIWELGVLAGRDGYLFGTVVQPVGSLLASTTFVGVFLLCVIAGHTVISQRGQSRTIPTYLGHLTGYCSMYIIAIVLATGLADAVWFNYLPATSVDTTGTAQFGPSVDGVSWWFATLFNQPLEVHAFELGALFGVFVGILAAQSYPRASLLTIVLAGGFLFGFFDVPYLCATQTASCEHARLKPWYFLTGTVLTQFLVLAVTNKLTTLIPWHSAGVRWSKKPKD